MAYQDDRKWSDQFIPAIREIVGPLLLVPSSFEVDTKQAADLIILKAKDMAIAARVRRHGYADKYPYDFTVRSKRDSGSKTEMAKLLEGWGDWMFYGHSGTDPGTLSRWMVIDLHKWREELLREGYSKGWSRFAELKSNKDGTHFVSFDIRKFKPTIIVSSSHDLSVEGKAA